MEAMMETTDERMRMFGEAQIAKMNEGEKARMEKTGEAVRRKMSGPGLLRLPELLEQRRLLYGITDGAFRVQAAYDKILVFQLPEVHFMEGKIGQDSMLVMPESLKAAAERSAPRGVIVSAGLRALDELRSNGMDLGHIVAFLHASPWKIDTDIIEGKKHQLLLMHAGNIVGSEDTAQNLLKRDIFIDGPVTAHHYVHRATGAKPEPVLPAAMTSEEY